MNASKILEILSAYNRFWTTKTIDAGISRDLLPTCLSQVHSKEVLVLKGIRRSGKSTLMAQVINELLSQGIPPVAILRVNMEEPLFSSEYSIGLLEEIYQTYRERVYSEGKCWLFLDEIQQVPGWESWVRGRLETEDIKFFITGSSASMLSREIGIKLTGRNISFEVFPLSFAEYIRFHEVSVTSELDYMSKKARVRKLFNDYLKHGGFPEVALKKTAEEKKLLLKSYFDDILYQDIVSRYEVRDVKNLRNLAVYLLTQIARPTSISKLKNNFSISQDKTENYVSAILESYLLFQVTGFSPSQKHSLRSGFKPYAIDTGLRNRVAFSFSEDAGWQVENSVACFLSRYYEEIYFSKNGTEIDFLIKEGMNITKRVQVWYDDPSKNDIPPRELSGLQKTLQGHEKAESILLTNDYEDVLEIDDTIIRCIPVVKYLLGLY